MGHTTKIALLLVLLASGFAHAQRHLDTGRPTGRLGAAISLDGARLAVSLLGGEIWIHQFDGDEWQVEQFIQVPDAKHERATVVLNGDRLLVHRHWHERSDGGLGDVLIYHRNGQEWQQDATLSPPAAPEDHTPNLLIRATVSGNLCTLTGRSYAPVQASDTRPIVRRVHWIFRSGDGGWTLETTIDSADFTGDPVSLSVDLNSGRIAAGIVAHNEDNTKRRIWARIIEQQDGDLIESIDLIRDEELMPRRSMGGIVAFCGNLVTLGGFWAGETTAVAVFEQTARGWKHTATLTGEPADNMNFGSWIRIRGDVVQIGTPGRAVYLFKRRSSGQWSRLARIERFDDAEFQANTVTMNDETVAIAYAVGAEDRSGVRFYSMNELWLEASRLSTGEIALDLTTDEIRQRLMEIAIMRRDAHKAGDTQMIGALRRDMAILMEVIRDLNSPSQSS